MNYREWKNAKKLGIQLDFKFYNESHRLMKAFNLTNDTSKTEVHHLRDTEEQRNYNDTYYEFWGFNQDGTFEYGKYVVFFTHEEHVSYHSLSEETRKKISEANKGRHYSDETKHKMSVNNARAMLGKHHTEESKKKISDGHKGKIFSDEEKLKISEHASNYYKEHPEAIRSGDNHPMYGKHHTEESRKKMSESQKLVWEDSNYRIKHSNAMKRYYKDNQVSYETRRKRSETCKHVLNTPEMHSKLSAAQKNRWSSMSDEDKAKLSATLSAARTKEVKRIAAEKSKIKMDITKALYKEHKDSCGTMSWNEFQKYIKDHKELYDKH